MSDPISHHTPPENLENSTAITTVNNETMVHAAEQAARLVAMTAGKRQKSGRFAKKETTREAAVEETPRDLVVPMVETPVDRVAAPTDGSETFVVSAESAERAPTIAEPSADIVVTDTTMRAGHAESESHGMVAEARIEAVADPMAALRDKLSQAFHSNVEASVAFWISLIQVRSPSEAMALNAGHLHRQMETFAAQSRELSNLAQQAATASMTSLASSLGRPRG